MDFSSQLLCQTLTGLVLRTLCETNQSTIQLHENSSHFWKCQERRFHLFRNPHVWPEVLANGPMQWWRIFDFPNAQWSWCMGVCIPPTFTILYPPELPKCTRNRSAKLTAWAWVFYRVFEVSKLPSSSLFGRFHSWVENGTRHHRFCWEIGMVNIWGFPKMVVPNNYWFSL